MDNLRNYFFDPMEKEIAVLGENYLLDFIKTGLSQRTYSILTDKRLYVSGKRYSSETGYHIAEHDNLSLRLDIIHSIERVKKPLFIYRLFIILAFSLSIIFIPGFIYLLYSVSRHYRSLRVGELFGYLALIFVLPVFTLVLNRVHRRDLLIIKYDEGAAAIPASYYDQKQIRQFIEAIKLAKDELRFGEQKKEAESRDYNSIADELAKYKEMFDNGLIDEDEYQILKNRLIRLPSRF